MNTRLQPKHSVVRTSIALCTMVVLVAVPLAAPSARADAPTTHIYTSWTDANLSVDEFMSRAEKALREAGATNIVTFSETATVAGFKAGQAATIRKARGIAMFITAGPSNKEIQELNEAVAGNF